MPIRVYDASVLSVVNAHARERHVPVRLHFLVPSVAVQGVHDGLDRALLSGDASVLSVVLAHDHERHAPPLLFDFVLSVAVQVCEEVLDAGPKNFQNYASWKRMHSALFHPLFDSV